MSYKAKSILRLSDLQKATEKLQNYDFNKRLLTGSLSFVNHIYHSLNSSNNHMIRSSHFTGIDRNVIDVIDSNFLTAADIANDLNVSVRKVQGWLNSKSKNNSIKTHYRAKYHINNVVYVHRIRDDVRGHFQKIIYNHHQRLIMSQHQKPLGLVRPQAVVGIHTYAKFINTIYDPNFSKYEEHLYNNYRNKKQLTLLKLFVSEAQSVRKMQLKAIHCKKNLGKLSKNDLNKLLKQIIQMGPVTKINPNDLEKPPVKTCSKIVNHFNKLSRIDNSNFKAYNFTS